MICEPQNIFTIYVLGLYVIKRLKEQEMGMLSLPSILLFWFSSLHSVFGRRLRIRLIRLFCVI